MNDDFLNQFRKPPRREFAETLYQRIAKPMPNPSKHPALRYMALTVSIFAVMAAVLFLSPPARAFADSLVRQIGGYIFVQQPDQAATVEPKPTGQQAPDRPEPKANEAAASNPAKDEQKATEIASNPANDEQKATKIAKNKTAENSLTSAQDAAGASKLVGFTVLAPAYLPEGFVPPKNRDESGPWSIELQSNGVAASIVYTHPNGKQDGEDFLVIEELKYLEGKPAQTFNRPEIVDVTVRGQPGVWMPDLGGKSGLVWEENGITFSVVSNAFTVDQMMKIAESLGK